MTPSFRYSWKLIVNWNGQKINHVEWLKSHRHLKLPVVPWNTYCEAQKPSTPEVLMENYCFLKKKATQV